MNTYNPRDDDPPEREPEMDGEHLCEPDEEDWAEHDLWLESKPRGDYPAEYDDPFGE